MNNTQRLSESSKAKFAFLEFRFRHPVGARARSLSAFHTQVSVYGPSCPTQIIRQASDTPALNKRCVPHKSFAKQATPLFLTSGFTSGAFRVVDMSVGIWSRRASVLVLQTGRGCAGHPPHGKSALYSLRLVSLMRFLHSIFPHISARLVCPSYVKFDAFPSRKFILSFSNAACGPSALNWASRSTCTITIGPVRSLTQVGAVASCGFSSIASAALFRCGITAS
jgi:hypothetical protein